MDFWFVCQSDFVSEDLDTSVVASKSTYKVDYCGDLCGGETDGDLRGLHGLAFDSV